MVSDRRDLPRTLLPLDRWAQLVGLDPMHFRQITSTQKPPRSCANVWFQYSWQQSDQVGRYDVADAIKMAEDTFAQYLGYKLLPTWEFAERQQTTRPRNSELLFISNCGSVLANYKHFMEAGVEAKSLVVAGTAVVYTDVDGDGYKETATISFNTTLTDEEELAVFYPGEGGEDEWEIRPLRSAVIAGGVATIKLWRHQLVIPNLIEAVSPAVVDGDVDANFLTTVDVYRRYNDVSTQVTLLWNPTTYTCDCGCATSSCTVCGHATQDGCLVAKDFPKGQLIYHPATYSATTGLWTSVGPACTRQPDQLMLYYRAGLRDMKAQWPTKQMTPQLERAIAFYALALLDRDVCECSPIKGLSLKWREDLAINRADGQSVQTTQRILNNPLGTTRAAIFAWNLINEPNRRIADPVRW